MNKQRSSDAAFGYNFRDIIDFNDNGKRKIRSIKQACYSHAIK